MSKRAAIQTSPDVLHGTLVFPGTRVPVKSLFDYLKRGRTLADFLRDFPSVSRKQVVEVLDLAGKPDGRGVLFDQKSDLEQLALEQGVAAVADFESLLGDFWPEGESADEFIDQVGLGRRENTSKHEF